MQLRINRSLLLNARLSKYLKLAAKVVVSALLIAYVFSRIDRDMLRQIISQSEFIYLVPATFFFVISKIISSYRLQCYFRQIQVRLPDLYNIKLTLLGMYYNVLLPGGIGGDGYKIYLLNRQTGVKARSVFWAVILDRASGFISIVILIPALMALLPEQISGQKIISLAVIPLIYAGGYGMYHFFFRKFRPVYVITNIQSMLVQGAQLACVMCIILSLTNWHTVTPYLCMFLISSVVSILPITPGGVGMRDITFYVGAGYMGLSYEISEAISIYFYLITLMVSLSGIYFSLFPQKLGNLDR